MSTKLFLLVRQVNCMMNKTLKRKIYTDKNTYKMIDINWND